MGGGQERQKSCIQRAHVLKGARVTSRLELQRLVRAARRGSRAEQSDLDCRSEELSWAQEEVRRAGVGERARQRVRCYKPYARSRSQLALENPVSPKAHSL